MEDYENLCGLDFTLYASFECPSYLKLGKGWRVEVWDSNCTSKDAPSQHISACFCVFARFYFGEGYLVYFLFGGLPCVIGLIIDTAHSSKAPLKCFSYFSFLTTTI